MEQLKSKEYTSIAKLMRGFLEEIELVPYSELPSPQEIVKELKRRRYLENGITAQQLGCAEDGDQVVFAHYSPKKPPEEVFKILQSPLLEDGDPVTCHIVVLTNTIAENAQVEAQKARITKLAKASLSNRFKDKKRSKICFCTLHTPAKTEQVFSIAIQSRIRSPHYDSAMEFNADSSKAGTLESYHISSDVYIAKLFDIVSLYNHIGAELFARNVRYHIRDALNVESQIQNTLTKCPSSFYNCNNGIAMQIKSQKNLDRRAESDIRLTYSEIEDLSIINGAQTISAAANFFFQQTDDASQIENIQCAKKKAWVLLRVFYPDDKPQKNCSQAFDQISISLNRQKPITPMDVAYTCPQITLINSFYENGTYPLYCFKLLKRGQNEPGRFHYQLSDFGRIVTAYYYNAPGEARSSPTQVIVRYSDTSSEYDTVEFSESDPSKPIYAPFDLYDDKAALFLSWYKPVNFAVSISEVYRLVEKQYRNAATPDANTLAVLANGRYFFVAYVVNALNHAGKPLTAERSFANFDYSADHVKCAKEYIIELILQYSTLVAQFAETYLKNDGSGRNTLNSNDFKIPAFYQAWCDNTQGNDQISNWLNSLMAALGGTDEKVSEPA